MGRKMCNATCALAPKQRRRGGVRRGGVEKRSGRCGVGWKRCLAVVGWGGTAVWPVWGGVGLWGGSCGLGWKSGLAAVEGWVGLDWVGGLGWVWGWMGWKEGGRDGESGGNDDVIRHTFSIHAVPRALPLAQHEQDDVILRNNEKGLASK